MLIAMVWHLVLFRSVYDSARMRQQPLFHLGISSMIIQALVVAWIFPRLSLTGAPLARDLKFGLLFGLLMGSLGVLVEAGKYDVWSVPLFVACEGTFFLLQYAVVGMALGAIYRVSLPAGPPAR